MYGVIDALDAAGLNCPGHPDPISFGPRVEEDIATLGRNHSDTISQPAGSVIVSLLKSYGCHIPSDDNGTTGQNSSQVEAAPGCKDVEAYKDKAPADYHNTLSIWWNIWRCEAWAEDHTDKKLLHDSFSALNHLYTQQSSSLEEELWPNKNAPASCKVFQDYQRVSHDVMMAGIASKQQEAETVDNAIRAEADFRARITDGDKSPDVIRNLAACSKWASDSGQTVIALKIDILSRVFFEEMGWKAYKYLESQYRTLLDLAEKQDAALAKRPVVIERVTESRFQLPPSPPPPPSIHCSGSAFQTGSLTLSSVDCR